MYQALVGSPSLRDNSSLPEGGREEGRSSVDQSMVSCCWSVSHQLSVVGTSALPVTSLLSIVLGQSSFRLPSHKSVSSHLVSSHWSVRHCQPVSLLLGGSSTVNLLHHHGTVLSPSLSLKQLSWPRHHVRECLSGTQPTKPSSSEHRRDQSRRWHS